ncbi:GTPase IMAP family member GIMD1 [Oryzias melastigma]|uniref:GIMAP family P-loop NTPase domain containing 1 n=1 Tax=Oryzias melastigma TaxID=30732 RepID=A0A3B3DZF7_ORYME|nr:GTPase IMAP family member GIMD1 [Oryzias melastigma]
MDPSVDDGLHANSLTNILRTLGSRKADGSQRALVLNVLLLGDKQSGRSSVGNALIGGNEFQTGVSTATQSQLLSHNFPKFFRRQGAETDLVLRVMDTPPLKARPPSLQTFCLEGVHVLVVVARVDRPCSAHVQKLAANLLGPDWRQHTLIVFTHADYLKEAGLSQSDYLNQTADWMRVLSKEVRGGVCFLDNRSDWPIILGQPLRDQLLRLSAANHHRALRVRTDAEGDL